MDETLKLCLANLMSHMHMVQQELQKIPLIDNKPPEDVDQKRRYHYLTIMLIALNDCAHVGYDEWLDEFPSDKPVVDYFRDVQTRAIANKLIGECKCKSCKKSEVAQEGKDGTSI